MTRSFSTALGALALTLLATGWACAQTGQAGDFVAGLQPDRRPAGAPQLTQAPVDSALKQQRLAGISQPWPGQVERIAEQGRWYSPMFAAGMTGRYDLRGLHAESTAAKP